jgi:hypothetical protein
MGINLIGGRAYMYNIKTSKNRFVVYRGNFPPTFGVYVFFLYKCKGKPA